MNDGTVMWSEGQLLAFSALDGPAPYADGLVARMKGQPCGLEIVWPAQVLLTFPGLRCPACAAGGDYFSLQENGRRIRAVFADAWNLLLEGECCVTAADEGCLVQVTSTRTLVAAAAHARVELLEADLDALQRNRGDWLNRLPVPPALPALQRPLFYKAASVMKTQIYSPEGRLRHRWSTPDRFPHRHMWLWDSVFHAIGWRHLDPALARELISSVFDCQRADGFLPHMMHPGGQSEITQPPVLAYGMWLVHAIAPAPEWIAQLYQPAVRYLAWDRANRDSDGLGLLEWFIEGDPCCRSGESGMDNSSRFDSATRMDAVDFNCFLTKEYDCLAGFAELLGKADEARQWRQIAQELRAKIRTRLWDAERAFFFDYDVERSCFCPVAAVSGFLPLFCGAATPQQASALLRRLDDPQEFGTALPLPSVSRREATFGQDMWRGPAWLNMAWLVAEGLRDYGYAGRAEALRRCWLARIDACFRESGCIFEYYDALDERSPLELPRKGKVGEFPHQVIRDYGWSATLTMDWCFRQYE